MPAGALGFVGKHRPDGAPAAVADRSGQAPVAEHAVHVQVFDHEQVVVANHAGAGAVQEIGARGADFAVDAGDFGGGLAPVGRASAFAGLLRR